VWAQVGGTESPRKGAVLTGDVPVVGSVPPDNCLHSYAAGVEHRLLAQRARQTSAFAAAEG